MRREVGPLNPRLLLGTEGAETVVAAAGRGGGDTAILGDEPVQRERLQ